MDTISKFSNIFTPKLYIDSNCKVSTCRISQKYYFFDNDLYGQFVPDNFESSFIDSEVTDFDRLIKVATPGDDHETSVVDIDEFNNSYITDYAVPTVDVVRHLVEASLSGNNIGG